MADVLDRAQKLLTLANSSDSPEAQTAAKIFCSLILEHKIKLSLPSSTTSIGFSWPVPVENYTPPPTPPPAPRKTKRVGMWYAEYKSITAKFDNQTVGCDWCGKLALEGDRIMWKRGDVYYCFGDCFSEAKAKSRQ